MSDSRQVQEIFQYMTASRPTLEPTQPHIQLVPAAFSSEVKPSELDAHHSSLASADVKNVTAIPSLPHTSSLRRA
jgi:hypothetical protein